MGRGEGELHYPRHGAGQRQREGRGGALGDKRHGHGPTYLVLHHLGRIQRLLEDGEVGEGEEGALQRHARHQQQRRAPSPRLEVPGQARAPPLVPGGTRWPRVRRPLRVSDAYAADM